VAPLVPVDVRRFAERATPRGARAEQRRRFEKLAPADRHDSFLAIMRASYTQFAITRDQLHACPRSNAARSRVAWDFDRRARIRYRQRDAVRMVARMKTVIALLLLAATPAYAQVFT